MWFKYGGKSSEKRKKCLTKVFHISSGPQSSFTDDHNDFLRNLVNDDSQLAVGGGLAEQLENYSISKTQLNNHLKNNLSLTVKKPIFEAEARNNETNLQKRKI